MSMSVIVHQPEDFRARVIVPLPRRHTLAVEALRRPAIDVVVPVYNEEQDLARSVRRLHAFLRDEVPFSARITIADSASTDATPAIADQLASELGDVRVLHLNVRGRGRALAASWLTSDARVVAYLDVDLSTDLSVLLALVAPIMSGHSELSVGHRGRRSEVVSSAHNLLLRAVLRVRFHEARRGFKALRADVARRLIPEVIGRGRFFDTELLARAERAGLRIHELPVSA